MLSHQKLCNLNQYVYSSIDVPIIKFKKIIKIEVPYSFSERRNGDVSRVVADNSFVRSLLHWNPMRSIEDMCIDSWNWTCKNPDGYNLIN